MLTPYNSGFATGKFSAGIKSNPYQIPSGTSNAMPAFDVTPTSTTSSLFQSSNYGLPYASPATGSSSFDLAASPSVGGGVQQIFSVLSVIVGALAEIMKSQEAGQSSFDKTSGSKSKTKTPSPGPTDSPAPATRKGAQAADDDSAPSGTGNTGVADGKGWASNVNVFTSSNKDQESVGYYSNDQLVGGYMAELEKNMDKGQSLKEAHDNVKLDGQTPMRNHANEGSLVPGKGGKAVVVTGDGISEKEAQQFAEHLKKDYGMDVQVIGDATPDQLKSAVKDMGNGPGGQQCMVAVLAHGAKDDSGKANGNMALGKGNDPSKQWLSENDLQSMVNDNLAGKYDNVNVVVSSCFSGNYVQ